MVASWPEYRRSRGGGPTSLLILPLPLPPPLLLLLLRDPASVRTESLESTPVLSLPPHPPVTDSDPDPDPTEAAAGDLPRASDLEPCCWADCMQSSMRVWSSQSRGPMARRATSRICTRYTPWPPQRGR